MQAASSPDNHNHRFSGFSDLSVLTEAPRWPKLNWALACRSLPQEVSQGELDTTKPTPNGSLL